MITLLSYTEDQPQAQVFALPRPWFFCHKMLHSIRAFFFHGSFTAPAGAEALTWLGGGGRGGAVSQVSHLPRSRACGKRTICTWSPVTEWRSLLVLWGFASCFCVCKMNVLLSRLLLFGKVQEDRIGLFSNYNHLLQTSVFLSWSSNNFYYVAITCGLCGGLPSSRPISALGS